MTTGRMLILALTLGLAAPAGAQGLRPSGEAKAALKAVLATGTTDAQGMTTYAVASVAQEYELLALLGLQPLSQALVFGDDGTAYDLMETSGGPVRFDISAFFGEGF